MFILIMIAVLVATTVITMLIRPHNNGPIASSIGDFSFPTATEGRAIPVAFGTVKIGGGNTVWWGKLITTPIKQSSGLFSKTTVGFKYLISVQYVLCQGQ